MNWGERAGIGLLALTAVVVLLVLRWPQRSSVQIEELAAVMPPTASAATPDASATGAPAPRSAPPPVSAATPDLAGLMALPTLSALLAATAGDSDPHRLELRQATMLSCLLAHDALTQRPWAQEAAAHATLSAYYEGYCQRITTDSPVYIELQREAAQRNSEVPARSAEADQMLDRILNREIDAPLIEQWLDRLVETPVPDEAYALASAAIDPDGPLAGELKLETLRGMPNPRRYEIGWAVADLLACQNGPLCAAGRAHTVLACIDRFNCTPGAARLAIRRDAIAPRDWRIAEQLVLQIRELQARRH